MIQVYDKYGKIKQSGIPGFGTVTAVSAGNLSPLFNTTVTSPTSTPNISFSLISQAQRLFFSSPNSGSGVPSFRAIQVSDLPSLSSTYVPVTRNITINGTTFDLSADRTWSVGTVTSVAALTLGTTGTDLNSSVANSTTTPVITLNVPTASATNRGALSSTDWTTFNNKIGATEVERNSIQLRANGITLTTFTRFGYATASDVTSGVAAATASNSYFGRQNRFNYATSAVAGTLAFFRTTFSAWGGISSGRVCEWLFGTADAATVAGARTFVGFTSSFSAPSNVEPTTLTNCVGLARLSTSSNWHIIHNDASGTCTSIDLGSGYPSDTLEVDLIYLRITFNTDGTISYLVANKTTSISTSGNLTTNLPSGALYETIWTTNNATALVARLGFCYRTFSNP